MKFLMLLFLSSTIISAQIKPEQIKPGADIVFQMPKFGNSWRSKEKSPVEVKFILPDNFDPEKSYPLILALGGGAGGPDACKRWHQFMEGKHFIFMGVDYNKGGYDSGFEIASAGLKVLEEHVKVDRERMTVTGFSSGAYSICHMYNGDFGKQFLCYIPMGGGGPVDASVNRKKHWLWVCGDKDTQKASAGSPRIVASKKGNELLQKAKVDSTMLIMKGAGHNWPKEYNQPIKEWVYEKIINAPLEEAYSKALDHEKAGRFSEALNEFSKVTDFKYKESVAKAKKIKDGYEIPFNKAVKGIEEENDFYNAAVTFTALLKEYKKPMATECEEHLAKIKKNPLAVTDIRARTYFLKVEKAYKAGKVSKDKIKVALEKVLTSAADTKSAALAKELMDQL